jgi:hypothetical protein
MFGFFRRSTARPVSDAIRHALERDGLTVPVSNPSQLRMVESGGRYSNRKVTYFRIFDPAVAIQRSLDVQRYRDLDSSPALVLRSGHVEQDGRVVVVRPHMSRETESPIRTRAGRTVPLTGAGVVVSGGTEASTAARPAETSDAGGSR